MVMDNLDNMNGSGRDGISNKLLETIKGDISQSLTFIINQTPKFFLTILNYQKLSHCLRRGILNF